jgi:phage-related protein (TIGR01555 family)
MSRVGVASVARAQARDERKLRAAMIKDGVATKDGTITPDSFVNFLHKMGVGADNPLSSAGYGFNPVTRIRTMMEWIHRGSWIGGIAVDVKADDMTREGVDIIGNTDPEDAKEIERCAVTTGTWKSVGNAIRWARLYGGALGVMLIDGQDESTPLRLQTIGRGAYKGLAVLDRWMVEPSLNDLVQEGGPDLGLPKFYNVMSTAPALRGKRVHYSRCIRLVGVELPYWQALMENLWGISVIERLFDRMIAFDSATTGAAQLVYRAFMQTYKIKGLRAIAAAGGAAQRGLMAQVEMMRRFRGTEGMTLIDGEDELETQTQPAFSGLSDAVLQFAQQVSGATGVPMIRIFGQAPAGLNSNHEGDLRMYYDSIKQEQNRDLRVPMTKVYTAMALSSGVRPGKDYGVEFRSLWQMPEKERSEIAKTDAETINSVESSGLISQQTALKELKQLSKTTGRFTNITDEDINSAESEPRAPEPEVPGQTSTASSSSGGKKPTNGSGRARDSSRTLSELKRVHDLDVAIESPKGSRRSGEGWTVVMPDDYGYIRRTKGLDGREVDCYVGGDATSGIAYVIDQVDPDTRAPDEDKVLLGYDSMASAIAAYASGFTDGKGLARIGAIRSYSMKDFKGWLASDRSFDATTH